MPIYTEVKDCFPEADLIREKAETMSYKMAEQELYEESMATCTKKLFSLLVSAGQTTAPTTDLRFFLKKPSA